jgi:predicted transcriptional regulator
MPNAATSVRITGDANVTAAALAQRLGASKAHVIEMALRALEERLFWDDVKSAYDGLAEDAAGQGKVRPVIVVSADPYNQRRSPE